VAYITLDTLYTVFFYIIHTIGYSVYVSVLCFVKSASSTSSYFYDNIRTKTIAKHCSPFFFILYMQCIAFIEMLVHSYIVPDWIDDSDVALRCSDENSIGRYGHCNPERGSREPHTTNELVVVAVA